MSHIPTNRRRLAAPEPEIISKPTVKRQVNPSTTSTVYNLTNHFSRLNPNSNPQPQKSLNYPPSQKLIDVHSQAKSLSKSAMSEPSNHALNNKVVKKGKRVVLESGKEVKRVDKKQEEGSKKELQQVMKIMKPNKEVVIVRNSGIGNSKSFNDAQVELNNFLLTNSAKLVAADMPPFIQIHAIGFARKIKDSLEKFSSKNLASSLKKEFDGVYGPAWHCIVGSSFGSFVTHSVGGFLYFSLDQKLFILLFKTNVQRAD